MMKAGPLPYLRLQNDKQRQTEQKRQYEQRLMSGYTFTDLAQMVCQVQPSKKYWDGKLVILFLIFCLLENKIWTKV